MVSLNSPGERGELVANALAIKLIEKPPVLRLVLATNFEIIRLPPWCRHKNIPFGSRNHKGTFGLHALAEHSRSCGAPVNEIDLAECVVPRRRTEIRPRHRTRPSLMPQ